MRKTPLITLLALLALLHSISLLEAQFSVQQLTTNVTEETWGVRHGATSRGKVLWVDEADTVVLYNGVTTNAVQRKGSLDDVQDFVFALGSGSSPGQVIAAWRRGDDSGWVSMDGGPPMPVKAANPFSTNALPAEEVTVADGCVFINYRASSANVMSIFHVFRIDPATGMGTSLTGSNEVLGADSAARISTSGCQAAWYFNDSTNADAPYQLHFYNGSSVSVIDSGIEKGVGHQPDLSHGRIVYIKKVGGVGQVFLYDSSAPSPAPIQLTTDTVGTKSFPRTDGQHVVWLLENGGSANRNIILYGGLRVTRDDTALWDLFPQSNEHPFQLQRRQLLWQDQSGRLFYADGTPPVALNPSPSQSFDKPWLADGFIAWLGLSNDAEADREVFRFTGTTPMDSEEPAPPLLVVATPGDGQATVQWDKTLDATSYDLYFAQEPGLTKENYQTLAGGTKITDVTSPHMVTGLSNGIYYFMVTVVDHGIESLGSGIASARICFPPYPLGGALTNFTFYAVASDQMDHSIAYAAGGGTVYKSVDCGISWNALAGGVNGRDIRALAVNGASVYAATRQGDILRSTDGGTNWTVVAHGADIGEQIKSLAIDPLNPTTVYAGDFELPEFNGTVDSYVIKSTNSGGTWFHLPDPSGDEIRAYALAINPQNPTILYAAGGGMPNVAKSTNGGTLWTNVSMAMGYVYALTIDSAQPDTLYAGFVSGVAQVPNSLHKSTNGGNSWTQMDLGFPTQPPAIRTLLVNPANHLLVHAGTDAGHYFSTNGGNNWTAGNGALPTPASRMINALTLGGPRHLIAATAGGLFLLDLQGNTPSSVIQNLVLTANSSPGGTVTRNPDQAGYATNAVVTLTAAPESDWGFTGWSGDASGTSNPLQVLMTTDKTITANFASFMLTTVVSPVGSGMIARSPNWTNYAANSTVTLTATPIPGFAFYAWSGDASGTNNPITIAMTTNKLITAYLAGIVPPDLIVDNPAATFSGFWSTNTSALDKYGADYRLALTATHNSGIAQWFADISVAGNYDVYVWYPHSSFLSTNALYDVYDGSGIVTLRLNQRLNGGTWRLIAARKNIPSGTRAYVRLSSFGDETSTYVVADAVRFLWSTDQLLPPIIQTITRSGGTVGLRWLSQSGSIYRVQFKPSLDAAAWIDLSGDVTASGSTASNADNTIDGAAQRFYRVILLP